MKLNKRGLLIILSGPSGAGKGTVLKELMSINDNISFSISATTREPREGEVDGVHYYFIPKDRFVQMISQDGLLEYAEYCGNYYGTPREMVERCLDEGKDVVLEIEVQGASKVMKKCPDAVSIFIMPPSMEVLEHRLRKRGTEDEETVQRRLTAARLELKQAVNYQYIVFNGHLPDAVGELDAILTAEKHKFSRIKKEVQEVLEQC